MRRPEHDTARPAGVTPSRELKRLALEAIDREAPRVIALSREIHAHPEYAYAEHETVGRLLAYLQTHETVVIEEGTAGLATAFRAWVGAAPTPTVGLVCEYDAVPGLGHGCGHNLIAAGAIAALVAVAAVSHRLAGRVMVIGSPAEEGRGGKLVMVRRGAYDGLAAVLQVHPSDRHRLSGPTVGLATLTVEFRGKAAHAGSAPDRGVNALDAVVHLFTGLNAMRQQVRDGCRVYGIITRGGDALHTVPEHTTAEVGVRADTQAYLEELVRRVEACARGAAITTGCQVAIERPPLASYPPMKLNRALGRLMAENLRSLGQEVEDFPPGFEGYANDVAAVSRVAPAALLNYGIGRRGLAEHSVEFVEAAASDTGHQSMLLAAKAMAMTAIDLLSDPALLSLVGREFEGGDS
jgi:amidohydrolase